MSTVKKIDKANNIGPNDFREVKGSEDITAVAVIEYLKETPDFFTEHLDLLKVLEIPHPCGTNTTSLIERQVLALREQISQQKDQFAELMENARKNEILTQQLHKLTLSLIRCTSVSEMFSVLYDRLTADFTADAVQIRIFQPPRCTTDGVLKEFSDWGGVIPDAIEPFLETAAPACIQARVSRMTCLFGEQASEFGSGMLVPLEDEEKGIFGILGIGSQDPERFRHTLGTIFMEQLGEIISYVITPYVTSP